MIDPDALIKRWAKVQRDRAIEQAIGEGELFDDEIAERFGISLSTVQYRRVRMGYSRAGLIPRRPRWPERTYHQRIAQTAAQAFEQGHSIKSLSEATGIPDHELSKLIRSQGVATRRPPIERPMPQQTRRLGPRIRKEDTAEP